MSRVAAPGEFARNAPTPPNSKVQTSRNHQKLSVFFAEIERQRLLTEKLEKDVLDRDKTIETLRKEIISGQTIDVRNRRRIRELEAYNDDKFMALQSEISRLKKENQQLKQRNQSSKTGSGKDPNQLFKVMKKSLEVTIVQLAELHSKFAGMKNLLAVHESGHQKIKGLLEKHGALAG
ncbi:hypothetical protein TWF481_010395 [Arthrobotrys musiformis]|uniref:Uncharacterized protein n=1 Tax=Arthrobotrys musiformis TaxID=47236 RepID=A0AAV9W2N4_9PEZI